MPETAMLLGGFIRWLLKGCKTNLRDEMKGNLDATWGSTYDFENYIVGIASAVIILVVVFSILFWSGNI